ncbi:coiled-coil domain-containing protein 121 [Crocuta crocuta]
MGWTGRVRFLASQLGWQPIWASRGDTRGWEDGWRWPRKEALAVVGEGLRAEYLRPRRPEMRSPQRCPQSSKMKKVRFSLVPRETGNRAAREPAARTYSAAREVQPIQAGPARAGVRCDPRGCWAAPRHKEHRTEKLRKPSARGRHFRVAQHRDTSALSLTGSLCEQYEDLGDEPLDSQSKFAKESESSTDLYLNFLNAIFERQTLTKSETKFKEKAMRELRKLNSRAKQAQMRQESLMQETKELYNEKLLVQTENQFFLDYLNNETEKYRRQPEELWNQYLQKREELAQRRQELASKYAKQTSGYKEELLQKENLQSNLKQQLQALRGVSLVKEKQEREMQVLEDKKKEAQAEIDAKKWEIQVQLVQEKALLDKQLSESDRKQLGKRKRQELVRRAHALQSEARQYTFEFYRDVRRENRQLKKELEQQAQQCQELQATKGQLINQKQQLQQEQWYVESLVRGRNRLQKRHNPCPGLDAPEVLHNTSPKYQIKY